MEDEEVATAGEPVEAVWDVDAVEDVVVVVVVADAGTGADRAVRLATREP